MAGAQWVRLDSGYWTNPKAVRAGKDGRALHLCSIAWCHQHLTDGHIPGDVVPTLCTLAGVRPAPTVERLLVVGLWLPAGPDYYVKDYLEMQQSRGDVEAERERWRERARRYRERRQATPDDDPVTP